MESINSQHQQELQLLRQDHEQSMSALRQQTYQTVTQVKEDSERRIKEAEESHAAEVDQLNAKITKQRQQHEQLRNTIAELEAKVTDLKNEIRESKLNNMFSVSKSGEKLIRVVRSMQELASELDETSRTVTDGEYSFFEQIKDQRDRDVVLSLAGGTPSEKAVMEAEDTFRSEEEQSDEDKSPDA